MKSSDEARFVAVAQARAPALRRTAYALCSDWHLAEDLVQQALLKAYVAWPPRDEGAVAAFLSTTLLRVWIDQCRRPWWRFERITDRVPDMAGPDQAYALERQPLVSALRQVPPRQRAVLVLRFLEDRSVEETALLLRCTTGTVKSQTARGLDTLRAQLRATAPELVQPMNAATAKDLS